MFSYLKGLGVYLVINFVSVPLLHLTYGGLGIIKEGENSTSFFYVYWIAFILMLIAFNIGLFKSLKEFLNNKSDLASPKKYITPILIGYCILQLSFIVVELRTEIIYELVFKR